MKLKIKKNPNSGFSIIEVLVTLFIVGAVLVLYQAAAGTIRLTKNSKQQEIALRVANNKTEELRAGGYAGLPASGGFSDSQLSALPNGSGNMAITNFNADTKQIIITVQWQNIGDPSVRNVSLATLVTKIGGI